MSFESLAIKLPQVFYNFWKNCKIGHEEKRGPMFPLPLLSEKKEERRVDISLTTTDAGNSGYLLRFLLSCSEVISR